MRDRRIGLTVLLASLASGCAFDRQDRRPEPAFAASEPATVAAAAAPGATSSQPPEPAGQTLAIGPQNTAIRFVGASLMNKQPGSFSRFDGQITLPSDDPLDAQLAFDIDMDSVTTNIPLLTKHLKRADFLDVEHFPRASFVSRRIERMTAQGATHVITGDLTMHGVTRTLSVPAQFTVSSDRVELNATIALRQSEFGMERAARKTDDLVPVTVSTSLARR